jgi:SWIM zinc finger
MSTSTQQLSIPHRYRTGWLIPSQSHPGTQYFVNADATRCTCKSFSYRGGTCKHLRIVLEAKDLIEEMLGDA